MRPLKFLVPLIIAGCSVAEIEQESSDFSDEETFKEVQFCIHTDAAVKGIVNPDDCLVSDVNVIVYRNGILVNCRYTSDVEAIPLKLPVGQTYNVYALANIGEVTAPVFEEEFRDGYVYRIESLSDLDETIPMCGSLTGLDVNSASGKVSLQLRRLAGRVVLSVDKTTLDRLQILSVKLCQSASAVHPFKYEGKGGSRAESIMEVFSGDYATEAELSDLNDGDYISFYTLENCQGVLLPDNTDPSAKVPLNIKQKALLCTYVEMEGVFLDGGILDGTVKYRFYLGLDACRSFDVPGNSSMYVQLTLTGNGLDEVSWRVSADVEVRDGYAFGTVQEGLHQMSDLYVGEVFLYKVKFADDLLTYLKGNLEGCRLKIEGEGSEGIEFTYAGRTDDSLIAEGRCVRTCRGELVLYSADGERIATLCDDVSVSLPRMLVSEFQYAEDGYVEPLSYIPECEINGQPETLYVYLTDKDGNALNSADAYGFDFSLFDLEGHIESDAKGVASNFTLEVTDGNREDDGCAYNVIFGCSNDGGDEIANASLADLAFGAEKVYAVLGETEHSISCRYMFCPAVQPVTFKLVDNGWAGYYTAGLSAVVDNPSNLSLDLDVWQVNTSVDKWNAISRNEVVDYVESSLDVKRVKYITEAFVADFNPVFVSGMKLVSERNGNGDPYLEDGRLMVYPLEKLDIDDICSALLYDKHTQDALHHLVDVTVSGYGLSPSDLIVVDSLSNGTRKYDIIYGDFNDRGIWAFSDDVLLHSPGNQLGAFPNVAPGTLRRLQGNYDSEGPVRIFLEYDGGELIIYTYDTIGKDSHLTLTCRFSGTVTGYVQTHPNGTIGKAQDNYCEATFDRTVTGIPLDKLILPINPDGGVLKEAMDEVYSYTFPDSYNWVGTDSNRYEHHAHPVTMECRFEAYVEGIDGKELHPVEVVWVYDVLKYHHVQEDVTYNCELKVENVAYDIAFIGRK